MSTRTTNQLLVKDFMSNKVISINDTDSLQFVFQMFERCHISGAPILSAEGKVIGVLSKSDLMNRTVVQKLRETEQLESITVSDITYSKAPVAVVDPEMPLEKAAELMVEKQIHRVFVRGEKGSFSGILSSFDVMKAFVQSGQEKSSSRNGASSSKTMTTVGAKKF
ncbi:MAG: CBS domain-containing protein [Vampirovibrio sp.]|nr:CBS domain-containing protein [Vampirovibrio sp.]